MTNDQPTRLLALHPLPRRAARAEGKRISSAMMALAHEVLHDDQHGDAARTLAALVLGEDGESP